MFLILEMFPLIILSLLLSLKGRQLLYQDESAQIAILFTIESKKYITKIWENKTPLVLKEKGGNENGVVCVTHILSYRMSISMKSVGNCSLNREFNKRGDENYYLKEIPVCVGEILELLIGKFLNNLRATQYEP